MAAEIDVLKLRQDDVVVAIDTMWVVICTALVFWEQAGFALVEAGSVRRKNVQNILIKNILDVCIGAITFFLVGFALSFGKGNAFIGYSNFALEGLSSSTDFANWFFQWCEYVS